MRALECEELLQVAGGDRWGGTEYTTVAVDGLDPYAQTVEVVERRDGASMSSGDIIAISVAISSVVNWIWASGWNMAPVARMAINFTGGGSLIGLTIAAGSHIYEVARSSGPIPSGDPNVAYP